MGTKDLLKKQVKFELDPPILDAKITSKLTVAPPASVRKRSLNSNLITSESHADKLDQTNMDFSHTDDVKIQNNIFNQYCIITNG